MSITADCARGSSGGPIMDKHGNAVGLVARTVSVYYTQSKEKKDNLLMVFKNCVPASAVLKLINR